jgi:hypothetical protein
MFPDASRGVFDCAPAVGVLVVHHGLERVRQRERVRLFGDGDALAQNPELVGEHRLCIGLARALAGLEHTLVVGDVGNPLEPTVRRLEHGARATGAGTLTGGGGHRLGPLRFISFSATI